MGNIGDPGLALESASKAVVVVDGVEYEPVEHVIDPPVESPVEQNLPPVDAPTGNTKPWYAFIKSNRFWALILGALAVYLETKGWIGAPERNFIATVSAVFITVATADRGAEKMAGK